MQETYRAPSTPVQMQNCRCHLNKVCRLLSTRLPLRTFLLLFSARLHPINPIKLIEDSHIVTLVLLRAQLIMIRRGIEAPDPSPFVGDGSKRAVAGQVRHSGAVGRGAVRSVRDLAAHGRDHGSGLRQPVAEQRSQGGQVGRDDADAELDHSPERRRRVLRRVEVCGDGRDGWRSHQHAVRRCE